VARCNVGTELKRGIPAGREGKNVGEDEGITRSNAGQDVQLLENEGHRVELYFIDSAETLGIPGVSPTRLKISFVVTVSDALIVVLQGVMLVSNGGVILSIVPHVSDIAIILSGSGDNRSPFDFLATVHLPLALGASSGARLVVRRPQMLHGK